MKERMIFVSCPYCGNEFQIKRDTVIVTGMSSTIVKRLLDRTHFSHLCSKCHRLFDLTYPFTVRNPDKKYNLILSDEKDRGYFNEDEKVIVVKSAPQFYLAFNLLENNLNFKIVLQIKKKLEEKLNDNVWFESYDQKNHCLWFEHNGQLKAIPLSLNQEKEIHQMM